MQPLIVAVGLMLFPLGVYLVGPVFGMVWPFAVFLLLVWKDS